MTKYNKSFRYTKNNMKTIINFIIEEFDKYYGKHLINEKREGLEEMLWDSKYEELYRVANMIDRFGLDVLMMVVHD